MTLEQAISRDISKSLTIVYVAYGVLPQTDFTFLLGELYKRREQRAPVV